MRRIILKIESKPYNNIFIYKDKGKMKIIILMYRLLISKNKIFDDNLLKEIILS